jgi:hypothetical protein
LTAILQALTLTIAMMITDGWSNTLVGKLFSKGG